MQIFTWVLSHTGKMKVRQRHIQYMRWNWVVLIIPAAATRHTGHCQCEWPRAMPCSRFLSLECSTRPPSNDPLGTLSHHSVRRRRQHAAEFDLKHSKDKGYRHRQTPAQGEHTPDSPDQSQGHTSMAKQLWKYTCILRADNKNFQYDRLQRGYTYQACDCLINSITFQHDHETHSRQPRIMPPGVNGQEKVTLPVFLGKHKRNLYTDSALDWNIYIILT